MKILTLHCDFIRFQPLKKAIKEPEEITDMKEKEVKECLVVLTAVEKGDSDQTIEEMVEAVKKTAGEVKTKKIVIYPYAHLSSHLASPDTALEYLIEAAGVLKKDGYEVTRAPFGYYKSFELKVKGHPLSELSKEFHVGELKEELSLPKSVQSHEKTISPEQLLKELSRTKLDTSKLKENDHRILGQKLDLFSFNEASPGSVFWHPNGQIVFNELIKFSREIQKDLGYHEVSTPLVFDNKLWKVSGHWNLYKENMFLTEYEKKSSALKPMNCPGHMLLYRAKTYSYKDLPLRFSEYSALHRMELSGTLNGLFRVVRMHQDDSHIFVAEEQLSDEIKNVLQIFKTFLDKFGFKYSFTISVRSDEKKDKYLGEDALWASAEKALEKVLTGMKIKYQKMPGEAKFYGPSLDVVIKDSLGREWQCSTLQLDFNMPRRFELKYAGKDNKIYTPIVLHRAVFGSLERFIGILLEHTNGNLPVWLSPIQVRVINFTDRNTKSVEKFVNEIKKSLPDLRIDADLDSTTVSEKVRNAEIQRIPYIIVLGEKEEESNTLAVRSRGEKPKFKVKKEDFIKELKEKIEKRF